MTKKLTWRLGNLPTPDELRGLVKDKLLTKEEAREILFSLKEESTEARDMSSLKEEVKFLRQMVEKLSTDRNRVIEIIREIETPWRYRWHRPYEYWCTNTNQDGTAIYAVAGQDTSFSSITTF